MSLSRLIPMNGVLLLKMLENGDNSVSLSIQRKEFLRWSGLRQEVNNDLLIGPKVNGILY